MKNIFVLAFAVSAIMFVGCGQRNAATSAASATRDQAAQTHDHSACSHDAHADAKHDAHAGHNHDAHAGHSHEGCSHDHAQDAHTGHNHDAHAEHSHDAHAGHNHDAHNHEGCTHDHDAHAGHDHSGATKKSSAKKDAHAGHNHDAHAGHDHGGGEVVDPDEIVFPAAQAARTDFEVRAARRGTFREVIKCGGEISAAQSEVSIVAAPVAGVVTLYDGRVMASTPVRKGQKLFRVSSAGLASGDAVAKARVNFEQAEANYERKKELYADKLVTRQDILDAETAYVAARAEYEPLRNSDGRGGIVVTAPADGYIAQMTASAGDFVEMGQPLATVARAGRMQLRAQVSQRYFNRLSGITDANFRATSSDKYLSVSALGGELYSAGRIVSAGSSLVPVVFEFDNDGTLPDGAYVDVALLGRERADVLTLPLTAITEQQGLYYVYVQLDEECYSRREVSLGSDDGVNVEILAGVAVGDRVVTRGAVNVKMASASGAIPHGHSH